MEYSGFMVVKKGLQLNGNLTNTWLTGQYPLQIDELFAEYKKLPKMEYLSGNILVIHLILF